MLKKTRIIFYAPHLGITAYCQIMYCVYNFLLVFDDICIIRHMEEIIIAKYPL